MTKSIIIDNYRLYANFPETIFSNTVGYDLSWHDIHDKVELNFPRYYFSYHNLYDGYNEVECIQVQGYYIFDK